MSKWYVAQLTFGSDQGIYHSHSYYDIPVIDAPGRRIAAHRVDFAERHPSPAEAVQVGVVDAERPGSWHTLGESRAWSWQQGPMAQWVAGGPRLVYNDRVGERFVARLADVEHGTQDTLAAPVYTIDPEGRFALSLNMARLNALRPGYGYPGGRGGQLEYSQPVDDGVWRLELSNGSTRLILSLDRAVDFLREMLPWHERLRHSISGYRYWFNHAKIAPDGERFTVKLRWRRLRGPRSDLMGVSLTCAVDGSDLRLLADATSHVIWLNATHAYFWRRGEVALFEDRAPRGMRRGAIAPELIDSNVHIRHVPPAPVKEPDLFVLDTPYREQVQLLLYNPQTAKSQRLARFTGHRPARGPFRCDLHPCPSADGNRIVVTSLHDGGRQIYVLTRTHDADHSCGTVNE